MIAIDLSKQQELDADLKRVKQVTFTGNVGREGITETKMFVIIEKSKETVLDFSQGTVTVFCFFILF